MTDPTPITHPLLERAGVRHGFFTRQGGVSTGLYAGLNSGLGSSDDPVAVAENRRRVAATLGGGTDDLAACYQIHSTLTRVATGPWRGDRPEGDAVVTTTPGVIPAVLTADCAPVLLADGDASVIGAAHAGWKGALGGVVDTTIAAMEKLGARRERIRVVIGPCIGPASYEVGPEFPAPFLAQDEANAAFFRTAARAGHFMFDLPGYLVHRIARNGVAVTATGHDTLTGTDDFFSYRRNTLQGVRDYGRGLSAIALAD